MQRTATATVYGPIPHLPMRVGRTHFDAPVKIDLSDDGQPRMILRDGVWLPYPLTRDGKLVYALPGGRELESLPAERKPR